MRDRNAVQQYGLVSTQFQRSDLHQTFINKPKYRLKEQRGTTRTTGYLIDLVRFSWLTFFCVTSSFVYESAALPLSYLGETNDAQGIRGCSQTKLLESKFRKNPCFMTIASAEKHCQFESENPVPPAPEFSCYRRSHAIDGRIVLVNAPARTTQRFTPRNETRWKLREFRLHQILSFAARRRTPRQVTRPLLQVTD